MALKIGDTVPGTCTGVDNIVTSQLRKVSGLLQLPVTYAAVCKSGEPFLAGRKTDYRTAFTDGGLNICNSTFADANSPLLLAVSAIHIFSYVPCVKSISWHTSSVNAGTGCINNVIFNFTDPAAIPFNGTYETLTVQCEAPGPTVIGTTVSIGMDFIYTRYNMVNGFAFLQERIRHLDVHTDGTGGVSPYTQTVVHSSGGSGSVTMVIKWTDQNA